MENCVVIKNYFNHFVHLHRENIRKKKNLLVSAPIEISHIYISWEKELSLFKHG